ncbi:MAG: hypothetical protein AMJ79_06095 [Phycisphaerae bacterium SM23_30]|nr:MAG: hypothetical protein AMJ79_06095 [Phycisphaerae bacterium SM23_30]
MPPHQSLLLRNGNGNGVPEEGEINVKIIQMDLVSVPPIEIKHELGDDPLSQLRLGGMQESLPWVPVWLNNDPISPGNPLDFPAESFFDITFEVEIPPPTDHPYLEHSIVVESGGLLIARELLAFVGNDGITQEERWVWELHEAHWFDSDLGDAPDSTNSWFAPMTAYPWGTPASFPTVYGMGSPPHGPIHWFPFQMAYLGNNVTMEVEADLPPDMDPTTNIIPPPNQSDLDVADDGVLNIPLNLPRCIPVSFRYNVNIVNVPAGATLYANVWFDWDRSGDWNQKHTCINPGDAPEWAVQNQDVLAAIGMAAPAAGIYTITTPKFLPWHPPGADRRLPIWMRITLSETPWVGSAPPTGGLPDAGSGPPGGYLYGETEDYFFIPKKICCIDCPDFNGDGIVNMIDFAYFAAAWLKTCVIN